LPTGLQISFQSRGHPSRAMPALWWQGGLLAIAVVLQFSPAIGWAPALTLPRPGVESLSARHPSTGFPRKDFQARGRGLFSDSTAIRRGSLCELVATSKEGPSTESMRRAEEVAELKRRLAQREEEIRAMAAQRRASSEQQRARKRSAPAAHNVYYHALDPSCTIYSQHTCDRLNVISHSRLGLCGAGWTSLRSRHREP
jgi:hypothetical protein